jgi:hypothetical protein
MPIPRPAADTETGIGLAVDANELRTHVGQQHAAKLSGADACDFDYFESVQWTHANTRIRNGYKELQT